MPGDGPMVFGILIVGAIVCGLALWVEFTLSPPLWVHAAAVAAADLPSDRRFSAAVQLGAAGAAVQAQSGRGQVRNDASAPIPASPSPASSLFAILCCLGFWQLERLQWKLALIAQVDANMAAPPVSLDEVLAMR